MAKRMRRILCALLACVLFAAALPSAMAQTTYSMYFRKATKVYQKASSSSRCLNVPKNMKVTMVAAKGGWALVKNGSCYAFCKLEDLNLCSRLKGYVTTSTPLYASDSKSSKHTDSIGVNTEVYVIGICGSYFRVQNKSGSITGYMPMSCVGTQKVKTSTPSKPNNNSSSNWKSKVVALKWYDGGSSVLKKGEYGMIYDISTGISFKVYRMGGSSHADLEPATKEDTEKLKKIVGGEYSWDSRAVILNAGGYYVACAINTMPHGDQTITNNGYDGQFCLHMIDSKTHGSDTVNTEHQKAIQIAYNWAH